eukprot:7758829-Pyramimonas_sp.AAC.1
MACRALVPTASRQAFATFRGCARWPPAARRAKPSVSLGDEGHLGDEVGPLAPLLYHVKQVDQGLDAFVAH